MGWKKGDLGRFTAESENQPRFEVIGVSKDKRQIGVWYGGIAKIQTIPVDTFRKQCVNWWELGAIIHDHQKPSWLRKGSTGSTFQLSARGRNLTQAKVNPRKRWDGYHTYNIDAGTEDLMIRNIRYDWTSCLLVDRKLVVLLSLKHIIRYGHTSRSAWDRLDEDPFELDDDPDLELFDGM